MIIPLDTTPEAHQLQFQIMQNKSMEERFMIGIEMCETAYELTKQSILAKNPNLSKKELAYKIFERYYGNEFSQEEKARIKESMLR